MIFGWIGEHVALRPLSLCQGIGATEQVGTMRRKS